MRRLWIASAVFWLMLAPAVATAVDPSELVEGLTKETIGILNTTQRDSPERKDRLQELFRSSMDIPFVGRFVMGRYWRTMTPAEQETYMVAFERYVLTVYAGRLNEYSGETILVTDKRAVDDKDTIILSQLMRENRAPVTVDWRVRQTGGDSKVIDVSVEGVSMALSQRQEFASIVQREGVSGLIKRLNNSEPHDPGPPR